MSGITLNQLRAHTTELISNGQEAKETIGFRSHDMHTIKVQKRLTYFLRLFHLYLLVSPRVMFPPGELYDFLLPCSVCQSSALANKDPPQANKATISPQLSFTSQQRHKVTHTCIVSMRCLYVIAWTHTHTRAHCVATEEHADRTLCRSTRHVRTTTACLCNFSLSLYVVSRQTGVAAAAAAFNV